MPLTGKAKSAYTLLDKAIKRQGVLLDEAISELLEDMLGEEGKAYSAIEACLDIANACIAAEILGSTQEAFARIVERGGYPSPVRTPRGRDILAACGQLKTASERKRRRVLETA